MKKHLRKPLVTFVCLAIGTAYSQEQSVTDSIRTTALNEIIVSAIKVDEKTPMAFSNLTKREISQKNLGQDVPSIMAHMPSVITTTDAGNGIGYSSFRVRGSDASRVNVTLNGIPYNDAESQGAFWVNLPDFASSAQNIQLQRGVGTSTNGASAFGASLNLTTDSYSPEATGELATSFGSYNTLKTTVKFSSGLLNDKFEIAGRLSDIKSDGYIDRASSRLKSFYLQGAYIGETSLVKAIVFGGKEKTYQAWNGASQSEIDEFGRRYNSSGKYYDDQGKTQFYDNETDNYTQTNYQLHWSERWSDEWTSNVSLHYTKGDGYYENYKRNQKVKEYGLQPVNVGGKEIDRTDMIRRKHLDNHFYGMVFNANYKVEDLSVIFGGGANKYDGAHFGEILWTREPIMHSYKQQYYYDSSTKTDMNFFGKAIWDFAPQWSLFADMQYRRVTYDANGLETGLVHDTFNFFNPKGGITYQVNDDNQLYFSYAKAHREPSRKDYEGDAKPKAEKLDDFELGWRFKSDRTTLNVNAYYMKYKDQLVLTGELNDVGGMIRTNSGDSYRLGLEIDATVQLSKTFFWSPNLTISSNKNKNFKESYEGEVRNYGTTSIAFSPDFSASNAFTYVPTKGMSIALLTKFVGDQFMSNTEAEASKLKSYFVNDINANYEFPVKGWFRSISVSVLANNIFNVKYVSNGYYGSEFDGVSTYEYAGYYPQAEFNVLAGVTLKF